MKLDIFGCLALMFTYFKLTHQIDWSWWLVMSPLLFQIFVLSLDRAISDLKKKDGKS